MSDVLRTPLEIGSAVVPNRLYRAPVLEGAGAEPGFARTYERHFVENARHGVGLIIQGSSCVTEEGRTSPGMSLVDTRERVMELAPMVGAVHKEGTAIFLQIGHGGLYAMEGWHEPYASRRKSPLLVPSPLPWYLRIAFRGIPVHPMTVGEIEGLAERFGDSAAWAREAGYDGVQLGSANAKLIDQFLSPFYNRRDDAYGGSTENRARIIKVIRDAIDADRAGADFACTVKIPVETAPLGLPRTTLDECLELCKLAERWGYHAITPVEVSVLPDTTLSRGGVPRSLWDNPSMRRRLESAAPSRRRRAILKAGYWFGGRRSPFEPVWNRSVFRAAKAVASIPVFAVGGIRTAVEVRDILGHGEADMVGIGRPFYAEPDLAARIFEGDPAPRRCQNSNLCVPAQMLGMKGVCYNRGVKKSLPRRGPSPRPAPDREA